MSGNLVFNTPVDPVNATFVGCTNLTNTKGFSVMMGDLNTFIYYNRNDVTPTPIYITGTYGSMFRVGCY